MPALPCDLVDRSLRSLCEQLRNLGYLADVTVVHVGGEPDIRLTVCRKGVDVVVEILAFPISQPPSRHWEAVRVHDGDRAVWRGPNRDCARDALVRFIDALLTSPREHAVARYCLLG